MRGARNPPGPIIIPKAREITLYDPSIKALDSNRNFIKISMGKIQDRISKEEKIGLTVTDYPKTPLVALWDLHTRTEFIPPQLILKTSYEIATPDSVRVFVASRLVILKDGRDVHFCEIKAFPIQDPTKMHVTYRYTFALVHSDRVNIFWEKKFPPEQEGVFRYKKNGVFHGVDGLTFEKGLLRITNLEYNIAIEMPLWKTYQELFYSPTGRSSNGVTEPPDKRSEAKESKFFSDVGRSIKRFLVESAR